MSVSLKNIPRINKILAKKNMIIPKDIHRQESTEKTRAHLSLKNAFYKNEPKKIDKNLSILNFISNNTDMKYSIKTSISDSVPEKIDYELYMINKYNENLNTSLSFISEFDLEAEERSLNDSFNSCDNSQSDIEQIEIKTKISKNIFNEVDDEEHVMKLEKEWDDIKNFLLNK